jgi:hypothetical protein
LALGAVGVKFVDCFRGLTFAMSRGALDRIGADGSIAVLDRSPVRSWEKGNRIVWGHG